VDRVSALVVVRNGARFLAEALASIAAQTRPVDEIVVLDGGSEDETCAIAARCPGVRIVPQAGTGLAQARNQALAAAGGTVVAFLSHDDRWTPRKVETQLARLRAGTRPGLVLGPLVEFGRGGVAAAPPRRARTPEAMLADRAVFDRVGGFDPGLPTGCDMEWFARAALLGIAAQWTEDLALEKRRHGESLSADVARNRDEAFAALARVQSLRARRR
jgi:glycosyltransferase involved in cell wall biosynthesis